MAESHDEMVARYQAIMDGEPDDRPVDPVAQREVREWLAKFRPATHARPMPARALNRR